MLSACPVYVCESVQYTVSVCVCASAAVRPCLINKGASLSPKTAPGRGDGEGQVQEPRPP